MPKRWLVKRRWLVVLEATTKTRIYGQQQLGKNWCVVASMLPLGKFSLQNYIRVKYFCFSVNENIFAMKIKRITVVHTPVVSHIFKTTFVNEAIVIKCRVSQTI